MSKIAFMKEYFIEIALVVILTTLTYLYFYDPVPLTGSGIIVVAIVWIIIVGGISLIIRKSKGDEK